MRLRSGGRGVGYSVWRGLLESILRVAYRGDWPARVWGALPAAAKVAVTRHLLDLPPGDGESCRIAFISDLHVGPTTAKSVLEAAFAVIQRERPDVLLLGGDYVFLDAEPRRLAALAALVKPVECPLKLAVLGNHDLWTCDQAIVEALSDAGARVLINEAVPLPHPWSDVVVVGLDDPWTGRCDPQAASAQLNGEPVRIVLCHSPDGLSFLSGLRFDLFLAGHTHGGQIAAPWGPIVLPRGRMCREYPSGFGRFGSGVVYVSRGVGGIELPIRTFASPDIMVLELTRSRRRTVGDQGVAGEGRHMIDVASALRSELDRAAAHFRGLTESDAVRGRGEEKWVKKEILGHLIDSAVNNHQRFVRAQLASPFIWPGYDQQAWVRLQRYRERPWLELVELWVAVNRHLAAVIENVPADKLQTPCTIGDREPMSLEWWMRDYLRHLRHHLEQLTRE